MKTKALKEHLKTLSQLSGPSGYEDEIRSYLRKEWEGLVDTFEVDGLGSLIGIKRGTGPEPRKRIMLCAHMDEIGLIVTEIRNGYLRLDDIWGMDSRTTLAKPVLVHARGGVLRGIVASVPPHILRSTGDNKRYPDFDEQWVDLGMDTEEVEKLVRIGDLVTMEAPAVDLSGGLLATKAMDDRAGVASVTAALHYLKSRSHIWDVYAVASTQEEVGLFGAATAAYHVKPDVAIAIDVGFASQPGVSGDSHIKVTEGPLIGLGPNFHDKLVEDLLDTAKSLEMKLTVEPYSGGSGTDAWSIQISHAGIPTALFSIPIRNMHSTVETVSVTSVDRTGRLMAEFAAELTADYLDTIAWKPDEEPSEDNGDNGNDEDEE